MGNKAMSKMKKENTTYIVPRGVVKDGPKAKYQKKSIPQAATIATIVAGVEDERRQIQKTKSKFRHFVWTETSPAITPVDLVRKALSVVTGIYRKGASYVPHDTGCTEECPHVRASIGVGIHYHLLLRSDDPVLETMLIKKTVASTVYIEHSIYQVPVQCPLTTYHELYDRQNTSLLDKVGGVLYEMFGQVIQRGDLRPLNRINNEPIWESHKHSQIMVQEQLIAIVNAGPYRSVMSQMLGVLVREEGTVTYEGHGYHL
jgi:hypothetical protein